MALQVPNKGEPVNLIQPKGLKRLECIIDSLVDIVRTQHGCCNSVARWGRGGSKSQPVLRASFLELDVPYGAWCCVPWEDGCCAKGVSADKGGQPEVRAA